MFRKMLFFLLFFSAFSFQSYAYLLPQKSASKNTDIPYLLTKGVVKNIDYKKLAGKTTLRKAKGKEDESYYIYLPKDYSPSTKWPLFVGVHAYSFDGSQAIAFWKPYADSKGFILVCPNFRDGYQGLGSGSVGQMKDIFEEVKKDFKIDDKKVLMTGFSAGAQFAHRFIMQHPEYVQAVSIMAAGSYNKPNYSASAKHIKFLVMVGSNDDTRVEITRKYAQWLQEEGYDVKFKICGGVGHEVCSEEKQSTIKLFEEMAGK